MPDRRPAGPAVPVTVRVTLRGRVQGVGFRAWTMAAARRLGLDGWVRNRRDGSVEAVLSGSAQKVSEMLERMEEGPPGARVTMREVLEEPEMPAPGFVHRREP